MANSGWGPGPVVAGAAAGAAAVGLAWYVWGCSPKGEAQVAQNQAPQSAGARVAAEEALRFRRAQVTGDDPELLEEQLSRNKLYFGEAGQTALSEAFIVVVGLGGVGSHAAHMLARAGVGRLRLVDFDNLTLSSLNRHAVGTRDDVGRPKVQVCADHFHDVMPGCQIEALDLMFTSDVAERALGGRPTYVIDAIDDINTKTDLILACFERGLPVISALGAGAKADPSRVVFGDITDPVNDPMAAKLRYFLRQRLHAVDRSDAENAKRLEQCIDAFKVVYSYEAPQAKLAALTAEQRSNPEAFGAVANMRLRVLPVLGTMPAIIGMSAAAFVMTQVAQKPFDPRKLEPISQKFAHKLHTHLCRREEKEFGNQADVGSPIADQLEVMYVLNDVWRQRSCYQMYERTRASTRNLVLTRFDRSKPALAYNLLLLTDTEAKWHDAATAATGSVPALLLDGSVHESSKHQPSLRALRQIQAVLADLESQLAV
ncbi:uncharacterized protein MONBRDRAFT_28661 [Monosiga brevicollis MX1]|uniref:THIF-type NAD/FAD binding fold domain-containing protein n=1 Tax=Monosiga brevicollis TaxID=81824 RepID=A9V8T8_MONBE|nr:uncharacterized protein MONBRDRAFT_28661 [Monosiga brevicollis MX1]EDQ85931.1 predicted protein [Monosiga brevicollis MX1]|eukprot:XP_001749125.1 hypothetical protein [Monosiga brevicollis MX1]